MKKIREALQDAYQERKEIEEQLERIDPESKQYKYLELRELDINGYIRGLEFALFSLHDE